MKYITREDLIDVIQERMLDDSIQLDGATVDRIEKKAIAFVVSYISGRYKTGEIFNEESPMRHPILTQVISMIVTYRIVRRNAARKVPEDYKLVYDEAISILKNIQSGSQKLDTLPEVPERDDSGNPVNIMWGNTTNKDYFI